MATELKMTLSWKTATAIIVSATTLIGWGITWSNLDNRVGFIERDINNIKIDSQSQRQKNEATEKLSIRIDTKLDYVLKTVDEIKQNMSKNKEAIKK